MAWDQAKMNQIMNSETSNLKYQRDREREGLPVLRQPKIPKIISSIIDTNYSVK